MGEGIGGGVVARMVVVMGPPVLPGLFGVGEGGSGDEMKSAVDPAAGGVVDGIVVEQIQKMRDSGEALFGSKHAGKR